MWCPYSPTPRLTTARIAAFSPGTSPAAGEKSDSHVFSLPIPIAGLCARLAARAAVGGVRFHIIRSAPFARGQRT